MRGQFEVIETASAGVFVDAIRVLHAFGVPQGDANDLLRVCTRRGWLLQLEGEGAFARPQVLWACLDLAAHKDLVEDEAPAAFLQLYERFLERRKSRRAAAH